MTLDRLFNNPVADWMKVVGNEGDVALSSRIRLARNLIAVPFPNRADDSQLVSVVEQMRGVVNDLAKSDGQNYYFLELAKLDTLERNILVEKYMTSPNHVQHPENRAIVVREDAAVSIMVNEEDHLRIQCIMPGLNLNNSWLLANEVDDIIEQRHDIAFSEQIGYLTSCPTNLGTGLRASVMLHLPALVFTQQINKIITAATQLGLAVRGLYGEGSEAAGNLFQISNQLTLGYTEQEIVENLSGVVKQVVDHERSARSMLFKQSRAMLEDRVWRAFGILNYARNISGQEALSLFSEVRLGIDMNIIREVPADIFNELIVMSRPNYLQKLSGNSNLKQVDICRYRAEIIRDRLNKAKRCSQEGL